MSNQATGDYPWSNTPGLDRNPQITPEQQYINDGIKKTFDPAHPLDASGFQGILTVDMVLRLLTKIVGSLQSLAVVKAEKIQKILVPWQNAISEEMKSVHTFVRKSDSTDISGSTKADDDKRESAARDDMNRYNSSRTESLRSDRSMITDEIKMQQTQLQSLQDTIGQATNLFNTIMSKLSGINTALFR